MERLMRPHESTRSRLARALSGDRAAIDLLTIMIGVIVAGVVATVGVTTVAAAVPWSQNAAARADIASVRTAESAAFVGHGKYLSTEPLVTEGLIQPARSLAVALNPEGSCYVVASASRSGAVFYATSQSNDIHTYDPSTADVTWCLENDYLADVVEAIVNGTPPPAPQLPPPPAPDWRELVTAGNAITVILDVGVRTMSTYQFCLDVKVGSTSETPAAWQVDIDTSRPPFYGRTSTLWTSHSIIQSSNWQHISGKWQSSNPWNNTWNPGRMQAGSEYTFSVCESSMVAPPDRPETYTVSLAPSTAPGQWGGRVACLVANFTGTGVYPFFSGWAYTFDITPAISELESHGYHPERLSWLPNGSVGQTVSPNKYQPGVSNYAVTSGRDNSVKDDDVTVFTLCLHDD